MNLHQSSSIKEFNLPSLNRTRMTRIARIFADPCASTSSAQSAFYRLNFHLILSTKVNKTDNYSSTKYKQEIPGQIYNNHRLPENPATGGASPGSGVATPAPA
jgi:hypothetical protein